MNNLLGERYSDIFIFVNSALFGIGAFFVTYCWVTISLNQSYMAPNGSQSLLGATVAILLGGFFYSIVILRPKVKNNEVEREKASKIAGSLKIQAHTDPLTSAHNRRYFDNALAAYLTEFGKIEANLGLIVIDLDHFKQVNDVHGHDVGDMVLVEVALRLRAIAREYDVVARIGGEEFAIVTPCISKVDLLAIANRYRTMISDLVIQVDEHSIVPTASIGIATTSEYGVDAKLLMKAADNHLYAAKNNGRNQVVG